MKAKNKASLQLYLTILSCFVPKTRGKIPLEDGKEVPKYVIPVTRISNFTQNLMNKIFLTLWLKYGLLQFQPIRVVVAV